MILICTIPRAGLASRRRRQRVPIPNEDGCGQRPQIQVCPHSSATSTRGPSGEISRTVPTVRPASHRIRLAAQPRQRDGACSPGDCRVLRPASDHPTGSPGGPGRRSARCVRRGEASTNVRQVLSGIWRREPRYGSRARVPFVAALPADGPRAPMASRAAVEIASGHCSSTFGPVSRCGPAVVVGAGLTRPSPASVLSRLGQDTISGDGSRQV